MNLFFKILTCILISISFISHALSCTAFLYSDDNINIVGRNYEWTNNKGHLFVNKRNVQKMALVNPKKESSPLKWISKYGSITFNQGGREFPQTGINEKGLVVDLLEFLDSKAKYAPRDQQDAISEMQVTQYLLDSFATAKEVYDNVDSFRLFKLMVPAHFMICDTTTNCTAFGYTKGKLYKEYIDNNRIKVLTNILYEDGYNYTKKYNEFTRKLQKSINFNHYKRFAKTYFLVKNSSFKNPIEDTFVVLKKIGIKTFPILWTQWRIVYDIKEKVIHYHAKNIKEIKKINLFDYDYSCKTPVLFSETNCKNQPEFTEYTHKANDKMVNYHYTFNFFIGGLKWKNRVKNYVKDKHNLVCLE